MASSSVHPPLCCLLLLLLLLPLMSFGHNTASENRRFRIRQQECRLERINGLQPRQRFESEAGVTEYFDDNEQQLQCAGVTVIRRVVKPGGLFLPSFSNSPGLVYVIEGSGIAGLLFPGCPESFQSFEQQPPSKEGQRQQFGDQHQRIQSVKQGDVIAAPAGVAHWCYNNGNRPVVTITVLDNSNSANQLDSTHRQFMLAGSQHEQGSHGGQQASGNHFFRAFDTKLLAEALGVPQELAQKIQREDPRGEMVMVKEGLKLVRPSRMGEEREQQERERFGREEEEGERERRGGCADNALEQDLCTFRLRENIDNPERADFFNPKAGWLTKLNSQKLPILRLLQLSAKRGVMRPQAITTPRWIMNAHSIMYVTKGRARVQVANDDGRAVHDGELRQGQLLVVPQNFVSIIRAEEEGFEWVAFKTNENAIESQIAGQLSVFKGLPVDVIANSYRLPREEAARLKFGRREEIDIFPAYSSEQSTGRAYAVVK